MNKQELIKHFEEIPYVSVTQMGKKAFIDLIGQLDEPQKPVVPQFVADFITEQKKHGLTLSYSIDASMSDRVAEWYWDNPELFARAWLDGYTVEEKQYLVKIKATKHFFARDGLRKIFFSLGYKSWFTREELEQAGFGWVFDCPGVEVREVEEW